MKSVKEAVEASSDVEIGFDSGSMTSACSAKILRTAWTPRRGGEAAGGCMIYPLGENPGDLTVGCVDGHLT
jgi:hypothetical protein